LKIAKAIRRDYPQTKSAFTADIIAGTTVAIVALPLAIGFGITAGMSAAAGISTAIVAGLLAAVFGGSKFQVSGPTGAMTVVLVPVIAKFGPTAIPALGVLAGIGLLLLAVFKLGNLINRVPHSVVEGFTVGIALVITLQQLPMALGASKGLGERTLQVAIGTVQNALSAGLNYQTIGVVALTLFVKFNIVKFVVWLKVKPYIPASFSALLIATTVVQLFNLDVQLIGEIPRNAITWTPPIFENISALIIPALSITLLAAIESLLAARVADDLAKSTKTFDPNKELVGQGVGTVAACVLGGMPATGAIARTNVNVRSNATSRFAAITHSIVLLLIILFAAPLFSQIPSAAIAGVLIGTSFRIFNPVNMRAIFKSSNTQISIYLVTALATLAIDLIWGIAIGLILHLLISRMKLNENGKTTEW
jgi:SulP family sulfate permease